MRSHVSLVVVVVVVVVALLCTLKTRADNYVRFSKCDHTWVLYCCCSWCCCCCCASSRTQSQSKQLLRQILQIQSRVSNGGGGGGGRWERRRREEKDEGIEDVYCVSNDGGDNFILSKDHAITGEAITRCHDICRAHGRHSPSHRISTDLSSSSSSSSLSHKINADFSSITVTGSCNLRRPKDVMRSTPSSLA